MIRRKSLVFTYSSSVLVFLLLSASLSALQLQSGEASSTSPYNSGYDHGCDDAEISNPDDRYINQPGKGPSFHTDEFMSGYNSGYNDCSTSSRSSNNADEDESWNDSCYNAGYDDGQNGPFSEPTWDHCGDEEGGDDAYYDGFIDGCMDADNSREVCEQATDS
jgi:hypothetical protein